MELQNSYIFLKNPYGQKEDEASSVGSVVRTLVFEENLNSYIKKAFPVATSVDTNFYYKHRYMDSVQTGRNVCTVVFRVAEVVDTYYLDIEVSGKTRTQVVSCLESVQHRLLNSGVRERYIDIISYDAVSEHYCNKITPDLNTLERNLRKLFFNIYVVNFGQEYIQAVGEPSVQKKAKELVGKNVDKEQRRENKRQYNASNEDIKEIEYLQLFFYSMELGDVEDWLFTDRCTEFDRNEREKFLSEHKDLSELSDEELRKAFSDLEPKSDWERFFSKKIELENIKGILKQIHKYRNKVAHYKFFNKEEYQECKKLIASLDAAVLKAIRLTEDKDFAEKNAHTIKGIMDGIVKAMKAFQENMVSEIIASFSEIQATINQISMDKAWSESIKRINDEERILAEEWEKISMAAGEILPRDPVVEALASSIEKNFSVVSDFAMPKYDFGPYITSMENDEHMEKEEDPEGDE